MPFDSRIWAPGMPSGTSPFSQAGAHVEGRPHSGRDAPAGDRHDRHPRHRIGRRVAGIKALLGGGARVIGGLLIR